MPSDRERWDTSGEQNPSMRTIRSSRDHEVEYFTSSDASIVPYNTVGFVTLEYFSDNELERIAVCCFCRSTNVEMEIRPDRPPIQLRMGG